ncbi:CobQ/CobB/MinD/ParA nucleotide binding domain-containing protein [Nonomuraea solani]|uniref:CobQ/CobB/MinD/ParA nucleotide binding domain-containing protein n=1 Tax=Nonomuraea solani TaxID=1144553 RepID=A0A1H6F488_9ACTN|nr:hypothetical protein [Nonomuraea solani]SEH03916.1 CobQ/CobB/MinD/ParA nucleotide binding domain-containing protein [Nonomuraea solani]
MIYTFYSFKGGVGRSMALANTGELMARRGLRVLMIDFDLEAPGLERFFEPDGGSGVEDRRGVIDLLTSYLQLRSLPLQEPRAAQKGFPYPVEPLHEFVVDLLDLPNGGSLRLMPAGRRSAAFYERYAELVRAFDWDGFYRSYDGEAFFDWFRQQAELLADVVLIDARTGISEMSGVCTFQLADVVVMLVAPNRQNIEGCELIANALRRPELVAEGRGGRELHVLPVPSRVELAESDMLDSFMQQFERQLGLHAPDQLTFENSLFNDLKVPYVPRFSYVERLAVRDGENPATVELLSAYTRLATALVELGRSRGRIYQKFHAKARKIEPSQRTGGLFIGRARVLAEINDWLNADEQPLALVQGSPGSGKSALIRHLSTADTALHATVIHTQSCRVHDTRTSGTRDFIQSIARAIADLLPEYGRGLMGLRQDPELFIEVRQNIAAGAPPGGSTFVGDVYIGDVHLETAFDELIRRPGGDMRNITPPMLVLIDGLDEDLVGTGQDSITGILAYALSGPLPPWLRFLATTRPHRRVRDTLPQARLFDLDAHPAENRADVEQYVLMRLDDAGEAERIAKFSGGNFLLAALITSQLTEGKLDPRSIVMSPLDRFFDGDIKRRMGTRIPDTPARRRFLSVLATAYAPLTRQQIMGIVAQSGADMSVLLDEWDSYLVSMSGDRIALFHQAFRDFLRTGSKLLLPEADTHTLIGGYLCDHWMGRWDEGADDYAVRYAAMHLIEALRGSHGQPQGAAALTRLGLLVGDETYLQVRLDRHGPEPLITDVCTGIDAVASYSSIKGMRDRQRELLAPPKSEVKTPEALVNWIGDQLVVIYADAYERLRAGMPPGNARTRQLNSLVGEIQMLAANARSLAIAGLRGGSGDDGARIVMLSILQVHPDPRHFTTVTDAIAQSHSAFEQFHALRAAGTMLPLLGERERAVIAEIVSAEARDVRGMGVPHDTSRMRLIVQLMRELNPSAVWYEPNDPK